MSNNTSTARHAREALELILSATEVGLDTDEAAGFLSAAGAAAYTSLRDAVSREEREVSESLHQLSMRLRQMRNARIVLGG